MTEFKQRRPRRPPAIASTPDRASRGVRSRLTAAAAAATLALGCGAAEPRRADPPQSTPAPASTYTVEASASETNDRDFDGIADPNDVCPAHEEDGKGARPWDGCPETRDPARGVTPWAPLPKQAVKLTRDRIAISEEIRFARGSATIDAASETLLQSIAVVLRDVIDIELVEIAGHADEEGSDANNQRLTQQRASAVMKDLLGRGIAEHRLRAAGYSSYCAVDAGKDEAASARNRRVELRILRRAGQDLEPRWGGCAEAEKRGMKPPPPPKLGAEETRRRRVAESVRRGCATAAETKDCADVCAKDHPGACMSLSGALDGRPKVAGAALFDATRRACALGGLDACPLAARYLREGMGTARDERRAFETLDAACEKGVGAACTGMGLHYEGGLGVAKDAMKAVESYDDGCNLGDAAGCEEMARAVWAGRGVPENRRRAMQGYVVGCELGRVAACAAIAAKFKEAPDVLHARARALAALHVACEQDPAGQAACDAAVALGEKPGDFRPARVCAAGGYKACVEACERDPGHEACIELGLAELYGAGVRRAPDRAAPRFAAACKAGRATGCAFAALAQEQRGDHRAAADGYEAACSMGEQPACVNRARLELEGLGTYRDEGSATRAFDAACQAGLGVACAHLSAAARRGLGAPADPARAVKLLEEACARGFKLACPAAPAE